MKVGIMGHTSGIGKAIAEQFDNYVGYSRSNGYPIQIFNEYIHEFDDHEIDILVVSPHWGFKQTELLYALWERWRDKDKIIVLIGSEAGDNCYRRSHAYATEKASLDAACEQLSRVPDAKCKILNIRPGYVDTPRVEHVQSNKIDPLELAKLVKQLIEMKNSMWVTTVTMKPIT